MPVNTCDKYDFYLRELQDDLNKLRTLGYFVVATSEVEEAENIVGKISIDTGNLLLAIQSCESEGKLEGRT